MIIGHLPAGYIALFIVARMQRSGIRGGLRPKLIFL